MNKLTEKLAQLFNKKHKADIKAIIHDQFDWKSIKYNVADLKIKEELYQRFIDWLPNRINRSPSVLFFDNDKSRGYAITGELLISIKNDILGLIKNHIDVLIDAGYIVNVAEISSHQTALGMVTRYHTYLKPSLRFRSTPKSQQLYGNISIEYKIEDEMPIHFRVLSHTYNDQNFELALTMDELMQIFTAPSKS